MKVRRPAPVERYRRSAVDEYPYGALDLPLTVPGSILDADTLRPTFRPRACPYDLDHYDDWTRPRAAAYLPALRTIVEPVEVGWRAALYDDNNPYDVIGAWSHRQWLLDREAAA